MFEFDESRDAQEIAKTLGPGAIDQKLREAIQLCWMTLPAGKKDVNDLEVEILRLISRIFQNFREDQKDLN